MCRTIILQIGTLLLLHCSVPAQVASASEAQTAPQGYSTPKEAFDAFRDARARRDWRVVFLSMTKDARDCDILSTFDNCSFSGSKKIDAVMKKYRLESDGVFHEYAVKYRGKHGVDLEKQTIQVKSDAAKRLNGQQEQAAGSETGSSKPNASKNGEGQSAFPLEIDEEVLQDVVLRLVTDKVAFYEEANKALYPLAGTLLPSLNKIGVLSDLKVSDNEASGKVAVTSYHLEGLNEVDTVREDHPHDAPVHFRKVNGRWFLDELPCR